MQANGAIPGGSAVDIQYMIENSVRRIVVPDIS